MGTIEHLITVSGAGVAGGTPDVAEITVGVSATRKAVKEARAEAAAAMAAVIAAVKALGVADKDVQTQNLSLSPSYDYSGSTPRLTGYQFSNSIRVIVRELEKLSAVIDQAASVGATAIQSVEFRIDNPKRLETEARKLAMADARAKADALAALAGVRIVGVASISESGDVPMPPRPMMESFAAKRDMATPVEAGSTEISVGVTVAYLIG
jgi:uncharacterized protein